MLWLWFLIDGLISKRRARCPDCRETHNIGNCHIDWARQLNKTPTTVGERNPFLKMLKGPTGENPVSDGSLHSEETAE